MIYHDYCDYARAFGYEIRFVGLGMGYLVLGNMVLTETKDLPEIEKTLAMIGMAIMKDALQAAPAESFEL